VQCSGISGVYHQRAEWPDEPTAPLTERAEGHIWSSGRAPPALATIGRDGELVVDCLVEGVEHADDANLDTLATERAGHKPTTSTATVMISGSTITVISTTTSAIGIATIGIAILVSIACV
jgi:hypothetical protein